MPSPRPQGPVLEPISPVSDGVSDKTLCYVDYYEADSDESEPRSPLVVYDDGLLPFGHVSRLWNQYFVSPHSFHRSRDSSPDGFKLHGAATPPRSRRRRRALRLVFYLIAALLMTLGAYHSVEIILSTMPSMLDSWPHTLGHGHPEGWRQVACHSHNDYLHQAPLHSAIAAGCTSVEADAFIFNDEIYVGHSTSDLTAQRTLRSLYLDPLLALLDEQNPNRDTGVSSVNRTRGIFTDDPLQTLVLLVDFKTASPLLWKALQEQLATLRKRGYLTHFNGSGVVSRPVTVVASGSAPFDLVTGNATYRDVFFDAPLDRLHAVHAAHNAPIRFNKGNSHFASTSFRRTVGRVWGSHPSEAQLQLIRSHIRDAHNLGLRARYWDVPGGPGTRDLLVDEGVDVLGVDRLPGGPRGHWTCHGWSCLLRRV